MDNMIKKFRLGELFCGPGGLALGAIQASITELFMNGQMIMIWTHAIPIVEISARMIEKV